MSTAAQKQLEEYRKRQSQRYQQIEEEVDESVEEFKKRQEEERRRKQELEDMEIARKLQEELEMEQMRTEQNNLNSAQNQQLGNFYSNQLNSNFAPPQAQQNFNEYGGAGLGMNAHIQSPAISSNDQFQEQNYYNNNGAGVSADPAAMYYQEQMMQQEGVRAPDQIRTDKLIPDENDIMMDEVRYQQFLLQQQILMQEIESRKQTARQTVQTPGAVSAAVGVTHRDPNLLLNSPAIDQEPLLDFQNRQMNGNGNNNINANAQQNQEREARYQQQDRKRLITILSVAGLVVVGYVLFLVFVVLN